MIDFFREGLYYIRQTFFHSLTLENETKDFSKKENSFIFLRTYIVACFLSMLPLITIGFIFELNNKPFDWIGAYETLFFMLAYGLIFGLLISMLFNNLTDGLIGGLVGGLLSGLSYGIGKGLGDGLEVEQTIAIVLGLTFGIGFGSNNSIVFGLVLGIIFGLVVEVADGTIDQSLFVYLAIFISIYLLMYFRFFYILPHLIQYSRSTKSTTPFHTFRKSPIYWDQMIHTPLPKLKEWLLYLLRNDLDRGLSEIYFIFRERPYQLEKAIEALFIFISDNLKKEKSLSDLIHLKNWIDLLPTNTEDYLKGWKIAHNKIARIHNLAHDYLSRQTHIGQLKVLNELQTELTDLQSNMKLTVAPVGTTFEPLATQWLTIVEAELAKLQQQANQDTLPNPYIAGNPLETRDQQLFVGRRDILLAIETHILNTGQRPSLLLYGRRRTGKSSTLLNLPNSRFEPVYIDCQDAKWHESDQAFCYNLAHDIFSQLFQTGEVRKLSRPKIEQYEKNTFTQLDQFLKQAQKLVTEREKRILLAFDEYEELENSVLNGDISEKVLGKLRNLIQHSQSIVVLVSGSHRFEELTRLNWANYLINTHTLELSYLDEEPARELLTKPVPELSYAEGIVDEIIRVTNCQPYLLQAVASELINHLNSKQQSTATLDDLNTALDKTLSSASAYFSDTWRNDNSPEEQQVMRALADDDTNSIQGKPELQTAIHSLIRKEIVEPYNDGYRLAVDLFGKWIVKNQV